jgi:mannitol-specific phosphotransferase system IIBC component
VPLVAVAAPILTYLIKLLLENAFKGYQVGFELLLINGFVTLIGLFIIMKPFDNKYLNNVEF